MTRIANLPGVGGHPRRRSKHERPRVPYLVTRTIGALRALCERPLTVAELARAVDMPLSAAYRWLDYLVDAGLPIEGTRNTPATYWIDPADLVAHLGGRP